MGCNMKKVLPIIIMLICVVGSVLINLNYNKDNNLEQESEFKSEQLAFVDIRWTRVSESDTEFIGFNSDGHYYYYCACGNPVNDSDLCETYTYDNDKKTISLECMETTYEMVTEIKVVSYSEDKLVLDFNGDIREFERGLNE